MEHIPERSPYIILVQRLKEFESKMKSLEVAHESLEQEFKYKSAQNLNVSFGKYVQERQKLEQEMANTEKQIQNTREDLLKLEEKLKKLN